MGRPVDVIQALEAGLRGTHARQSAVAVNIANLSTPGYKRAVVDFEARLREALDSGRPLDLAELEPEVTHDMSGSPGDNNVDVEVEVGELIKNAGRYKMLMRLMSKAYQQMDLAMRE